MTSHQQPVSNFNKLLSFQPFFFQPGVLSSDRHHLLSHLTCSTLKESEFVTNLFQLHIAELKALLTGTFVTVSVVLHQ